MVWAALIAAALLAIAAVTRSWYENTDDVTMNGIAAGRWIASAPDQHLVWTSSLIGWMLKAAYRAFPDVPWYGGYLLLAVAAAIVACLTAFGDLLPSWPGRLLVLAFLVATASTTITRLQYTRVAFLVAESGWLLLARATRLGLTRHRPSTAIGGSLIVAGSLIRWEIAPLTTVLSAPLIAVSAIRAARSHSLSTGRRLAGVLAAVVVVCGVLLGLDSAYYRADPGWHRFLQFNADRRVFMDSGRIREGAVPPAVLESVGWSVNDLSMLQNWFALNTTVFSLDRQQRVIEQAAHTRTLTDRMTVGILRGPRRSPFVWVFLAIAATALLLAGDGLTVVATLATIVVTTGALIALAMFWQLPARFYEPALSVPAAAALAGLNPAFAKRSAVRLIALTLGCGVSVALTVQIASLLIHEGRYKAENHQGMEQAIRLLNPSPADTYVIWAGDFASPNLITPTGGFSDALGMRAFAVGWANHSPLSTRRLEELGIGDLYVDLWRKSHIFLISDPDRCDRLTEFIGAHYGQVVECSPVFPALSVQTLSAVSVRGPSINIRFRADVSREQRRAFEEKYGLRRPRPKEDRTWRYELSDRSLPLLAPLVNDLYVEDTSGLDRQTGRLLRTEPDW